MRTLSYLFLLAAALAPSFGYAQSTNWSVAKGGNRHSYQVFAAPKGITWTAASQLATNSGGYLVTITSKAENDFVFNLVNKNTNFWRFAPPSKWYGPWLGAVQTPGSAEPDGGWTWVTGEPFAFQNWLPEQPNNTPAGEDRIMFFGLGSMGNSWNDVQRNAGPFVLSYIVEYDTNARAGTPQK